MEAVVSTLDFANVVIVPLSILDHVQIGASASASPSQHQN
jgi:hypothetical protein